MAKLSSAAGIPKISVFNCGIAHVCMLDKSIVDDYLTPGKICRKRSELKVFFLNSAFN